MTYQDMLNSMFNAPGKIDYANNIITGYVTYSGVDFAVLGVVEHAMLDNQMALNLADFVLQQISAKKVNNLLILLDTGGQQVTRKAELLGLNRYFAHLIKALNYAKLEGMKVTGVVIGGALGGAFIATALNASKIYAVPDAQIAVMWLDAMSRVTKVPLAKLQELSKTSAIFAPGAENFYKLGVIEKILNIEQVMPQVINDLNTRVSLDGWRINGAVRGGRTLAQAVISEIMDA